MIRFIALLCALLGAVPALAVGRIEVQALMQGAAILLIDGQQHMLRNGQRSPEGVLLVQADPRRAVVEFDGRRSQLTLSQRIAGNFEAPAENEVKIPRNNAQQYLTSATINGHSTLVMVDTGANTVALSSSAAGALGIDFRKQGTPTQVGTAGGIRNGYTVNLDRVEIGGIAVNYVPAIVIEGDSPQYVLLGATFLQHVNMRQENGIMYLRQKY